MTTAEVASLTIDDKLEWVNLVEEIFSPEAAREMAETLGLPSASAND